MIFEFCISDLMKLWSDRFLLFLMIVTTRLYICNKKRTCTFLNKIVFSTQLSWPHYTVKYRTKSLNLISLSFIENHVTFDIPRTACCLIPLPRSKSIISRTRFSGNKIWSTRGQAQTNGAGGTDWNMRERSVFRSRRGTVPIKREGKKWSGPSGYEIPGRLKSRPVVGRWCIEPWRKIS